MSYYVNFTNPAIIIHFKGKVVYLSAECVCVILGYIIGNVFTSKDGPNVLQKLSNGLDHTV